MRILLLVASVTYQYHYTLRGVTENITPFQDGRYGKNAISITESGARYKVSEHTHTSSRLTGHLWLTRVTNTMTVTQ